MMPEAKVSYSLFFGIVLKLFFFTSLSPLVLIISVAITIFVNFEEVDSCCVFITEGVGDESCWAGSCLLKLDRLFCMAKFFPDVD